MKGDFSRLTFNPKKHYRSVHLQQGRMQIDADWNEQAAIQDYLHRTESRDIIGLHGAPKDNPGFAITIDNKNILIGRGHYYVNGILCENEEDILYTNQPDYPNSALPDNGAWLVYLDVWQRHLTALNDLEIREAALGGADTATRTKNIWQVKLVRTEKDVQSSAFSNGWQPANALRSGTLRAQTTAGATLENQLYRIEIHNGSNPGTATFKWSRDNSIVAANIIEGPSNTKIRISDPGQGILARFAPGQWVEISDEERVLNGQKGIMVKLIGASGQDLTVEAWPQDTVLGEKPFVRLWDHTGSKEDLNSGAIPIQNEDEPSWIDLEDGLQVEFDDGEFRNGDYWLIPARNLTGNIEWPRDEDGNPLTQPPHGIHHHYAPLALLTVVDDPIKIEENNDFRHFFAPTTRLVDSRGDTMTGPLEIQNTLEVHDSISARSNLGVMGNLGVKGNLGVEGNLEVHGEMIVRDIEKHAGNILLGDEDIDIVTIRGTMCSAHSSDKLQIEDDVHVKQNLTVDGNVGIGTADPSRGIVDIRGSSNLYSLAIRKGTDDNDDYLEFHIDKATGAKGVLFANMSDTDNGFAIINQHTGAPIRFGVNNAEVMRIKNGNVGIGTTEPKSLLHVNGSGENGWLAQFINTGTTDANGLLLSAGNDPNEYSLKVTDKTGTITGLAVKANGNVSIGMTEPNSKLEVWRDTPGLIFSARPHNMTAFFIRRNEGASQPYLDYNFSNGNVLVQAGNVGIGTTNPNEKLDVNGNIQTNGKLRINGNLDVGDTLSNHSNRINSLDSGKVNRSGDNIYGYLTINGNVGIGTTSPQRKLHVAGDSGARFLLQDKRSSGGSLELTAGSNYGHIFVEGAHPLWLGNNNMARIIIASNGNVDIGTSSSGASLEVMGHILQHPAGKKVKLNNISFTNKYLEYYINDIAYGVSMWASSKRFKEKITLLELDTSKIYNLKPVSFNWKPDRGGQRDFGMIAEEVEKIFPFLVTYDKEGNPFSVKYEMLSVLLLNEWKKKVNEINVLSETVNQLKVRTGNDFAEYFESVNGKSISPGTSVILDNAKVRPAMKGEIPSGVISSNPTVLSGMYLEWPNKYLRDEFGTLVIEEYKEEVVVPKKQKKTKDRQKTIQKTVTETETRTEVVHENGKYCQKEFSEKTMKEIEESVFEEKDLYDSEGKEIIGKHKVPVMETYEEEIDVLDENGQPVIVGTGEFITKERLTLNPEYDETKKYITREKRSEWNCVGLLGQIPLRKGQPVAPTWVKIKDISDDVELWLVK